MKHQTSSVSYVRYAGYGVSAILLCGVVGAGWWWYAESNRQAAQVAAAEVMDFYQASVQSSNPQAWKETIDLADQALQKSSRHAVSGYTNALKADAQIREGMLDEAARTQGEAVARMRASALTDMHTLKHALLLYDSSDEQHRAEGKAALQRIAEDRRNAAYYAAQFYIGYDVFVNEGQPAGRAAWSTLLAQPDTEHEALEWREKARGLLEFNQAF